MSTTKVTITTGRGEYSDPSIKDEPYATALATIREFQRMRGGVFRGVRFSNQRKGELGGYYFKPHKHYIDSGRWDEWCQINEAGGGSVEVPNEELAKILDAAAKIDAAVNAAVARGPVQKYRCAGARDGCVAHVTAPGSYCTRCAHDA